VPEVRHATWPFLGASLVVGLAALVRMADPGGTGADDITSVIRLPAMVTTAIGVLFGLAALLFLTGLAVHMRRARRHEEDEELPAGSAPPRRSPWLQTLTQLATLANFIVLAYLLSKHLLPLADFMGQAGGSAGGGAQESLPSAPFLVTWTFAGLALAAGCAAVGLALWFAAAGYLTRWFERDEAETPPPLAEAVEESLEDLRGEMDARRAITRCFARFERAAAAAGLERRPWQTAMEFMHAALSRLPAPPSAVRTLTALFELARFSDRPLGSVERDRALAALDDVKAAIDDSHRDAIAP
jgi:Domain of unknown function (DUF4129)